MLKKKKSAFLASLEKKKNKKKLEEPPCWRQVVIASLNGTWFASEPACLAPVSL